MKKYVWMVALFAALAMVFTGCGGGGGTQYTVTFDKNFAENVPTTVTAAGIPASYKVDAGSKIAKPADPTRSDAKAFQGWYKEWNQVTAWNFETDTINANTTLWAKWEGETPPPPPGTETVTITFNLNLPADSDAPAPEAVDPRTIEKGGAIGPLPGTPAGINADNSAVDYLAFGLYFKGWYTAASAGAVVTAADTYDEDGVVYAQWYSWDAATKVAVIFNTNYEGAPADTVVITDTGAVVTPWPADPTREGVVAGKDSAADTWKFSGWKEYDIGSGKTYDDTTTFSASAIAYAYWEPTTGWPADNAPEGTDLVGAEKVVLANSTFVVYRFVLASGDKWEDFDGISADYMVGPATINKANGARAIRLVGNHVKENFTIHETVAPAAEPGKKFAVANYNVLGNNCYILHAGPSWTTIGNAATTLGIEIKPYEWFTIKYTIDGTSGDGNYNKAYNDFDAPDPSALPDDDAEGPFHFGLGIPDNNNGGNVHYIRNVKLLHKNNPTTKSITATPLWIKDGDDLYPAYVGYPTTSGADGVNEFFRAMCDGSQPTPVNKDW